ncbi:hypothetical protein BKA70DRAFT_1570488 [Coprinopsis sp. MPI-PUGE-AT-0042]|nr:hypothetical protein BKA70DRAFT_1570488 [Coprinopsis sp. MPI-PUGE-AT-0042]
MPDREREPLVKRDPADLIPITRVRPLPGVLNNAFRLTMHTIVIRLPDDTYHSITAQHFANIVRLCEFLDQGEISHYIPTNFISDSSFDDWLRVYSSITIPRPSLDFPPIIRSVLTNEIIPHAGRRVTLEDVGFNHQLCGFRPKIEVGTISVHGDKKATGTIHRLLIQSADENEELKRQLKRRRFDRNNDEDYSGAGASGSSTPMYAS